MCVGKCSRIVGPCLLVLGTLSMAASILLLFPGGASKYLLEGRISRHAKAVPGVWGGIAVSTAGSPSFLPGLEQGLRGAAGQVAPLCAPAVVLSLQVLLAATHITALGWQCSGCGTRHNVSHVPLPLPQPQGGLGQTLPPSCSGSQTPLSWSHGGMW